MTTSMFRLSDLLDISGSLVRGPDRTEGLCRDLLRRLRSESVVSPDDLDADEHPSDVLIAARVFHEVLVLTPVAARWPVFSLRGYEDSSKSSLFKSGLLHTYGDDFVALCRLTDDGALLAANVARWMLNLPQQRVANLIFTHPLSLSTSISPRSPAPVLTS